MDLQLIWIVLAVVLFSKVVDFVGKDKIGEFVWTLYTKISYSSSIRDLRTEQREAIRIYTARSNTNSKDEFAKWAKLDREYGRLKQRIETKSKAVNSSKQSLKTVIKLSLYALTTGAKMVLRFQYRKVPVIWLPPNLLPRYVLWILSFSSAPMGSVSVSIWLIAVNSAVSSILSLISSIGRLISTPAAATKGPVKAKTA